MPPDDAPSNLPAQIGEAIASIPKALVPNCVKALDRLLGAAVDIPVAWLAQQKAKIDAQTQAFTLVESKLATAAADLATSDNQTVDNALRVLLRKSYRQQTNREAVASVFTEELSGKVDLEVASSCNIEIDDDWLNVFERYVEDASTQRMQQLWGRVLAGEVRKPGKYATRTLRFLSEFSQDDGMMFAALSQSAFSYFAPVSLAAPDDKEDLRYRCLF